MGGAFESADQTTYVSRSKDLGKTWQLQGSLYDKSRDPFPTSDYFKPQLLRNESLIALGYRFHRHDPEQLLSIEATDGNLLGDDVISFSTDEGRSWASPRVIPGAFRNCSKFPAAACNCTREIS